ncbi:unnamed protein product, partial [Heterosigma akashiwo]
TGGGGSTPSGTGARPRASFPAQCTLGTACWRPRNRLILSGIAFWTKPILLTAKQRLGSTLS